MVRGKVPTINGRIEGNAEWRLVKCIMLVWWKQTCNASTHDQSDAIQTFVKCWQNVPLDISFKASIFILEVTGPIGLMGSKHRWVDMRIYGRLASSKRHAYVGHDDHTRISFNCTEFSWLGKKHLPIVWCNHVCNHISCVLHPRLHHNITTLSGYTLTCQSVPYHIQIHTLPIYLTLSLVNFYASIVNF